MRDIIIQNRAVINDDVAFHGTLCMSKISEFPNLTHKVKISLWTLIYLDIDFDFLIKSDAT